MQPHSEVLGVKAATGEFEGEHRTVHKRGEGSGSVCFRGGLSNLGTHWWRLETFLSFTSCLFNCFEPQFAHL